MRPADAKRFYGAIVAADIGCTLEPCSVGQAGGCRTPMTERMCERANLRKMRFELSLCSIYLGELFFLGQALHVGVGAGMIAKLDPGGLHLVNLLPIEIEKSPRGMVFGRQVCRRPELVEQRIDLFPVKGQPAS